MQTATAHPVVFAEALFAMTPGTASLIARGYRVRAAGGASVALSASALDQAAGEKEVDLDALPVLPEKEKTSRRRGRRLPDVGVGVGREA